MENFSQKEKENITTSQDESINRIEEMLNSEDYKQLASVISDSVNKALNYTKKSIKSGEYETKKALKAIKMQAGHFNPNFLTKENKKIIAPVTKTPAGTYSGPLIASCGIAFFVLACIFGISAILGGFKLNSLITVGIFLFFGAFFSTKGKKLLGLVSRFKKYLTHIDLSKPSIQIENLANTFNKSQHYIQRDLSRMIDKKMFLEGHLSDDGRLLFLTDDAYQNYLNDLAIEKQKQETLNKKLKLENEQPIYKEIHRVLEDGEKLVEKICYTNSLIQDINFKQKTEHLIIVINRILTNIQDHPENLSEIRRFMTYYLPTTEKIISAYHEMENQPVQGKNIYQTKEEINDSIDTIIQAYETLFDSLFINKAADISSDLAVMKTMFSREGLTNNDKIHQ